MFDHPLHKRGVNGNMALVHRVYIENQRPWTEEVQYHSEERDKRLVSIVQG